MFGPATARVCVTLDRRWGNLSLWSGTPAAWLLEPGQDAGIGTELVQWQATDRFRECLLMAEQVGPLISDGAMVGCRHALLRCDGYPACAQDSSAALLLESARVKAS